MACHIDHRTWNVFLRRHDGALCCAVPAEAAVPSFLLSGEWDFGFAGAGDDPPVTGFCPTAAETGSRLSGFHLFLAFATAGAGRH